MRFSEIDPIHHFVECYDTGRNVSAALEGVDVVIGSTITYLSITYTVKGLGNCYSADRGALGFMGSSTKFITGTITLPSTIEYLGRNCFRNQIFTTGIILGGNERMIGECPFAGCNSVASLDLPESAKTIRYAAFCATTDYPDVPSSSLTTI
jgi:hypothetical protein